MKARTMNSKAVVAAALMMVAVTVVAARAASASNAMSLAHAVSTRTVMQYGQGAWTGYAAVVLKSEADWTSWNAYMAANNMAVGSEPAPKNVDWTKEALLVVSMGENLNTAYSVDVAGAARTMSETEVTLGMSANAGGNDPCVVVAMDKRLADVVMLMNGPAGVPVRVPVWMAPQAQNAGANVAATWGAVKAAYRQ
jgi:hypothetical protein